MSGTYPTVPAPKEIDFSSSFDTDVTRARSGRRYVSVAGGHLWRASIRYTRHSQAVVLPLFAFCFDQEGRFEEFSAVLPLVSFSGGDVTGSVPQVAAAVASGTSATIKGLAANKSVCLKGDVVRFGNHKKVYMLVADLTSDGLGNAVAQFKPPLVEALVFNESIVIDAVPFNMSLATDDLNLQLRKADRHGFSIEFEESY